MAVWSTRMRLRGSNGDWVEADPTHAGPGHRREPSRRAGGDMVTHRRRRQRGRGQRPGACARRRRARPRRRRTRGGRGSGATSPAAEYWHSGLRRDLTGGRVLAHSSFGPPAWAQAAARRVRSTEESAAAAGGSPTSSLHGKRHDRFHSWYTLIPGGTTPLSSAPTRRSSSRAGCLTECPKAGADKGVHARRRVGRWPLQGLAGRLHRDADGQYRGRRVLQVTSPQEMALPMH
ncbi:hypothetical protein PAHAL_3G047900 [Panicum hallii]|uniref:Uncharacterized protein n=1 Tax=Panicum hallii TaxID=206008 RepID=A0A2T8KH48_9POAL|nr:hypothetical protein PAHAL_3G047900 [Panicum hallii]